MKTAWTKAKLEEICRPKQWKTLSSQDLLEEGFPVYGANGIIGYYSAYTHEKPTVMITCRGATCGTINLSKPKSYISGNAMALDSLDKSKCFYRFLMYFLRYRGLDDTITGSAQPQITRASLKNVEIPLPPIAEQRRIAAILDRADAVRRKRKEAIALTEELLRSAFLEMFGNPVVNSKEWETTALGNLLTDIESGWSPECDSREAEAEEWGVLKLGAVTWRHFDPTQNKALLSGTSPRPELEVKVGDLLITRKNTYELVGASTFVYSTRTKLMLPDLIFRLCLTKEIDPVYLWQMLSQKSTRLQLSKLASGTSGSMPNISKARLRTLLVPLPPLENQMKYREVVMQFWKQQRQQKNSSLVVFQLLIDG